VREEHGEVLSLSTPFQTHAIFLKKTLPCSWMHVSCAFEIDE
jgi:hypothetical protein